MEIPKRFKVANHEITVEEVEFVYHDGEYVFGLFWYAKQTIQIAQKLKRDNGDIIELSEEIKLNTFWHELFHCFNYLWNCELDEALAQTFANFMREYESTKQ